MESDEWKAKYYELSKLMEDEIDEGMNSGVTIEERELLDEIKNGPNMHMKLYAMLQNYRNR